MENCKKYILGIDTGGTYTDGVLLDAESKEVLGKAKALTTRNNLSEGIRNCIENIDIDDIDCIELVCLSTTLATNAVVENKGCKAGVLLIGKKIDNELPADEVYFADGLFSIQGKHIDELDVEAVARAAEAMKNEVEAIVVSGYASARNPEHELHAKEIISDITGLSVLCAHEITGQLGYYKRTVTAILNAKLIPIIEELMGDTKKTLDEKGIKAPVMIVKSDGSFMTSLSAAQKPIETIVSGPAASIIGAKFLSGVSDATVFDIGGTTSDIALVEDDHVNVCQDGAVVGNWRTQVKAADIYTYGLGGDSKLRIKDGDVTFGPDKTEPVSKVCTDKDDLEKKIFDDETSGITPTDIAHVTGKYDLWDKDIAEKAVSIAAKRLFIDKKECIDMIQNKFIDTIWNALENSEKLMPGCPIVAIGASAHTWLPMVAEKYGLNVIVPRHAEVANAIGAAVGHIEERVEILIRKNQASDSYLAFSGVCRKEYFNLECAREESLKLARDILNERIEISGIKDCEMKESVEDVYVQSYNGDESIYVETKICLEAVGKPYTIK